jgi:hypothetical protein
LPRAAAQTKATRLIIDASDNDFNPAFEFTSHRLRSGADFCPEGDVVSSTT